MVHLERHAVYGRLAHAARTTRASKASCRSNTGTRPTSPSSICGPTGADFATIDYSDEAPALYIGKAVDFDTLRLRNVRTFEGW